MQALIRRLADPGERGLCTIVALAVWLLDAALCAAVVLKIPYTEIDWVAYIQQAGQFLAGERNYMRIEGDTGPVVYPAGHLYIYSALLKLTNGGSIYQAQWIFAGLYLASLAVILFMYVRSGSVAPWQLPLVSVSRRLHSIYMLRLFNDCWAMFFAHVALALLTMKKFTASIVLFSLATSIKMNVLLMAPPVLLCVLHGGDLTSTALGVALGFALQVALGYPFLSTYPKEYIGRAFEFSRVFLYKWTVNLRFLPEPIFVSKQLALFLLTSHLFLLTAFAIYKWVGPGGITGLVASFWSRKSGSGWADKSDAEWTTFVMKTVWTGNLIGIVCARSLHYQFYSWYFWSLPFLLANSGLYAPAQIFVLGLIEIVWNLYPPSERASVALLQGHLVLLGFLWHSPFLGPVKQYVRRKVAARGGSKGAVAAAEKVKTRSAKKRE